jgi:hypothetical protein
MLPTAFVVMLLVWVVKVDPVTLAPVGVLGIPVAVAGTLVGIGIYRRARILGFAVVDAIDINLHAGERVMLTGTCVGPSVTSPWSGRSGAYIRVTRTTTTRRSDGRGGTQGRTEENVLGSVGAILVASTGNPALPAFKVDDGQCSILHVPVEPVKQAGSGVMGLLESRSANGRMTEERLEVGTRIWVTGKVAADGKSFDTQEWVQVSGRDARGQVQFVNATIIICAGICLLFFGMIALILSA